MYLSLSITMNEKRKFVTEIACMLGTASHNIKVTSMKINTLHKLRLRADVFKTAIAAFCLSALVACGGGGGGTSPEPVPAAQKSPTSLSGTVQDGAGKPVAGASISAAGQSATTGSDGRFALTLSAGTSTIVLVKKPDFATNAKEAVVDEGTSVNMAITLFADQVKTTFAAAAGASIAVNGAQVVIPVNAIQTAQGANYTGTVSVGASYYNPDTVAGVQAFSAPYTGTDAGVESSLISMGVIEVKLTDSAGNPLQLKTGQNATLTYPASSTSSGTSVPMWFYDEAAKIWVREGTATKQANGTFQGTVSHFTQWNADYKGVNASLVGCFRDVAGNVVSKVGTIILRGTGWQISLPGSNSDGNFTLLRIPAQMPLELVSALNPPSFSPVAIAPLAAGEQRQLPCTTAKQLTITTGLTYSFPATNFVPPPTLPPVTASPFAGNYTGSFTGVEVGTFSVTINAQGAVTGSAVSTTYNGLVSAVSGNVQGNGALSLTASGSAGAANFSGSISSAGAISGTWQYASGSGLTGGGTFTGARN